MVSYMFKGVNLYNYQNLAILITQRFISLEEYLVVVLFVAFIFVGLSEGKSGVFNSKAASKGLYEINNHNIVVIFE